MADTAPTTRPRWFRFSLGTLLLLLTLVAVAAFGIRERIHREQLQSRIIMLEAELEASHDTKLHKLTTQLMDVEVTIAATGQKTRDRNSVAWLRLIRLRDSLEAKIIARKEQLLKAARQRSP